MKFLSQTLTALALGTLLFTTSCDKDEDVEPTEGQLTIQFTHQVDGQPLNFDSIQYATQNGDSFSVSQFRYYISNVKLIKTIDNTEETVFTEPASYHLINARNESNAFTLNAVPLSSYNEVELAIGVDPSVNKTLDNSGDLDPENDMYWGWNSGYIFLKAEGRFIKTDSTQGGYTLHPGGDSNYKVVRLKLPQPIVVGGTETYTLTLNTNVAEIFKNPNTVDLNVLNDTMGGAGGAAKSTTIAENYANMISYGSLGR